jgi:hypothetical protein
LPLSGEGPGVRASGPQIQGASVMADRVIIFDTTLRDGEQTAGVALNADD